MSRLHVLKELLREEPEAYPGYHDDLRANLTAPIRNKLHNFRDKLKHHGGIQGHVTVKVRRAKRNSRGVPIDINGIEITNPAEYEERCVYEYGWVALDENKHNLLTTNGRDWIHEQVLTNTTAGAAEQGAHEIALTSDATGADAADNALPSEITTGGLARKDPTAAPAGSVTHTDDTNATSIVAIWTASATHNNVQMAGLFYEPTGATGQLIWENVFTATTLNNGDSLQLTWNLTIG